MKTTSPKKLLTTLFLALTPCLSLANTNNTPPTRSWVTPLATIGLLTTAALYTKPYIKSSKITKKHVLATALAPAVLTGLAVGPGLMAIGGRLGIGGFMVGIEKRSVLHSGLCATIGSLFSFCGYKLYKYSLKGAKFLKNAFSR